MDTEKLRKRKYTTALLLAKGERNELPRLYETGMMSIAELSEHYSTTNQTIIKALVFLGFNGPEWAVQACNRTLKNESNKPGNMKRSDSLI